MNTKFQCSSGGDRADGMRGGFEIEMSGPVRVLQVVTILNRGGAETMIMNYYRNIDRTRVQFDFLVHREEEGYYEREILDMGGRIYRAMPVRPGSYRKYFSFLKSFLKEHPEYRIIHSHNQENSGFILYFAKQAGVPVRIAHSHIAKVNFDLKYPFRLYARRYLEKSVTHRFSCGVDAGKELFGDAPFHIQKNAIDAEAFRYSEKKRDRARKELNISDCFVIGNVGRLSAQKNHKFLLRVFKDVAKREKGAKLLLIGDGPLKSRLERIARRLGIGDRVVFTGARSDVADLLQAVDIMVFPSLNEGLPVAVIEAQAAGVVCLLSDSVTREAKITDRVYYLPLDKGARAWAGRVTGLKDSCSHIDTFDEIVSSGYDIKKNAGELQDFYLDAYRP